MEPYAPTDAEPVGLHVADVLSDALAAVARNVVHGILAWMVLIGFGVASVLTCGLGAIVFYPLSMWGTYRFALAAIDGKADVGVMWSDLPPWGTLLLQMWLWFGITAVASLPVGLVAGGAAVSALMFHSTPALAASTAISAVLTTLYTLLLVRLLPGPFLIVDRGLNAVDALRESLRITEPVWSTLIGLQLVIAFAGAPLQVLAFGMQVLQQRNQADPHAALQALPMMLGMYAVIVAVAAVVGVVSFASYAAVYRRLVPAGADNS